MVSTQLRESVDALSDDERIELIAYIERSLEADAEPTADQHALVVDRVAEMRADPRLGDSFADNVAAARALIA